MELRILEAAVKYKRALKARTIFYVYKEVGRKYLRSKKGRGSSVQFSRSVTSNSLWPHEPQHARPPCPSLTPGVHPYPCPLSRWCRPTILFSEYPSSPALKLSQDQGLFKWVSHLFASGGQSNGVSASISVLPMNTQDWSPLGWTGWICCSPRDSQESSPIQQFKSINSSVLSFLHSPTLISIHDHWKNHSLD